MSEMLPDRYPVFWNVRRRLSGRVFARMASVGVLLTAIGVYLSIGLLIVRNAESAASSWQGLLWVQHLLLAVTATIIAVGLFTREREQHTLEPLFLTPMSSRAIVLEYVAGITSVLWPVCLCLFPAMICAAVIAVVSPWVFLMEILMLAVHGIIGITVALLVVQLVRHTRTAILWAFTLNVLLPMLLNEAWLQGWQSYVRAHMPAWLTAPMETLCALMAVLLMAATALQAGTYLFEQRRWSRDWTPEAPKHTRRRSVAADERYLPDRAPIFWDNMRQRLRGGRIFTIMLGFTLTLCLILLAKIAIDGFHYPLLQWPRLGAELFEIAWIGQLVMMSIISPALTATIFSNEREAKRLEFLFLTKMPSREIVFGYYQSALGMVLLTLISGMPLIAIIAATMGGIAPGYLCLRYATVCLFGLVGAAIGLTASCNTPHSMQTLMHGYLMAIAAFILLALLLNLWFLGFPLALIIIRSNLNGTVWKIERFRRRRRLFMTEDQAPYF